MRCPTIILLTAGKALTIVIWLYKVRQRDVYHPIEAAAVRFSCTSVWREKKKSSFLFFFIMLLIMTIERKSTKGANCSNPSHRIRVTLQETEGSHSQTRSYLESAFSTVWRFCSVLLSWLCSDCTLASRSSAPLLEQVHILHSIGNMHRAKVILNIKTLLNKHENYVQNKKKPTKNSLGGKYNKEKTEFPTLDVHFTHYSFLCSLDKLQIVSFMRRSVCIHEVQKAS